MAPTAAGATRQEAARACSAAVAAPSPEAGSPTSSLTDSPTDRLCSSASLAARS